VVLTSPKTRRRAFHLSISSLRLARLPQSISSLKLPNHVHLVLMTLVRTLIAPRRRVAHQKLTLCASVRSFVAFLGAQWGRPTEPVVFRWHHKGRDRIPREVLLHGQWDDDHPIRLVTDAEPANANNPERQPRRPTGEEETVFITIINLPPGTIFSLLIHPPICSLKAQKHPSNDD
jgi:hypothetical protein